MLKKDQEFVWNEETQKSFDTLKEKLCNAPLLIHPDFNKEFNLTTDSSGYAIGGVLSQGKIGEDQPVAYVSKAITDVQKRCDTYNKEGLALTYCIGYF